ncbi:MAG: AraC family transcriptional regulator [Chitinophagaceae bacterium]|nr:MAG: AraC family transcriptional regulator [Chitinophagaceae bacterium]
MTIVITKVPKHLSKDVQNILDDYLYPGSDKKQFPMLLQLPAKPKQRKEILETLRAAGVTTSDNKKEMLALKIRLVVSDIIETAHETPFNLSVLIADKLELNYTYLSTIFSEVYELTIEQHIIQCKIVKAKKLLKTGLMSVQQIASILRYSSPAHFSSQFKAITGVTPTEYRRRKLLMQ